MLRKLLIVSVAMIGFGFALVPFYKNTCDVAGINNTLKADEVAKNSQLDYSRTVSVEFDANTHHSLSWNFQPSQGSVKVHPGDMTHVVYEAKNTLPYSVTGQAIPSYGPQLAVLYFKKVQCFCFSQRTLKANEVRKMPVVFVIDPQLPRDVSTTTPSYTFSEVDGSRGKTG
jgi:cytochrome c oxidase assembly protein subunit 11